ncbi:hypothetical protein F5Y04DRAFT_272324 [Hypomontagnella monticulosa]|nr:hypothetical protein F5Y04DRAFT_272324 [Hypomontagnella monticulosa]
MSTGLICANWSQNDPNCRRIGKFACTYCLLVLYCGGGCQKAHWAKHKFDCRKNPLLNANWRPRWETENRAPAFMGGPRLQFFNYQKKYPWGNMPAFDLLNLPKNEGADYEKDLNLLFAASGDIRNVIRTIDSIPNECRSPIKVYMNDRDGDVVGRNAIMLLLALIEEDPAVAAENIIHTWYSSFISEPLYDLLKGRIRELVQDVCTKIGGKASNATLGKTWTFGSRSLRLVLEKKQWLDLLASLEVPPGLTKERAQEIRRSVTLAPERVDFRERRYFAQQPGDRASAQYFRQEGVLLPFGAPRSSFTVPNPTLFRNTGTWPLKDDADPVSGWSKAEILEISSGAATNDTYGKLNILLRTVLTRFHQRIKGMDITFQLLNVDAEKLYDYVGQTSFDRIEVSNISDAGYLGMAKTTAYIGRLLKEPRDNPHATLVALFLNAVDEMFDDDEKRKAIEHEVKEVFKYMAPTPPTGPYDASIMVNDIATQQVRDVDKYFERYMKIQNFASIAEFSGMEMKRQHTIIDPWPLRLKKKPHQKGAKEAFNILLSSGHSGCERYVEWRFGNLGKSALLRT